MIVEINNECDSSLNEERILSLLKFASERLYLNKDTELAVLFTDLNTMEKLHIEWMDELGPTDVLSFPMDEITPGNADEPSDPGILGDIVICPEYAQKGADERGVTLQNEVELLAVHGLLHLLGYDHATTAEEKEMFGIQNGILEEFSKGVF